MDIRKEYLEFFKGKGHKIVPSMGLIPNDPTLLFTNAGMVQFKDIFTGLVPIPKNKTATSCQLCIRAGGKHNDLENVGYTARHHTLFEMLGNFSFGDYFKKEAIAYAWEFITINLNLPKNRLWVTIHKSDDEAYELWKKHISEDRIKRFGDKDNFWSMGDTGACGPCSEIFYDQGSEHFSGDEDYLGGEGDRFLEIWNLVFMQYERDKNGKLKPLPKPSIDTGMGLERIVAIKEGKLNNFETSLFIPIIKKTKKLLNKDIVSDDNLGSLRVIADHLRAVSFMISQGILFDKEGRGYVLRRILRRAVRHGYLLGFREPFMAKLIDTLDLIIGDYYTSIREQKEYIKEQLTLEESRFFKTIALGISLFEEQLKNTKDKFSGEVAFKLYDTYGFPLDLTQDMLRNKNIYVDLVTFENLMLDQKNRAKASWKGSKTELQERDFKKLIQKHGKNEFVGYLKTTQKSKIISLLDENFKEVDILTSSQKGWVMLDKTPFYAQSGGQVGDIGVLEDENHIAQVLNTQKFFDLNLCEVKVENSSLKVNEKVTSIVVNRYEVAKHHSATHFLQAALKMVLGENITQAGSFNDASKLRFDFTYSKAMTKEEIKEVEDLVNSIIQRQIKSHIQELPINEAKKQGAIAMFGEKYGDIVRVVSFGEVSMELCGGTHVKNSSDIGSFYITKEVGVSAGVRRIEAVCGNSAIKYTNDIIVKYRQIQNTLKTQDVNVGIKKLKAHIKELTKELEKVYMKKETLLNEQLINGTNVVVEIINEGDLKKIVDDFKNKNEKAAIFLLQVKNEKVVIVAGCKNITIKASNWIQQIAPIVGGSGGGRDDFAQAGGKNISNLQEAKKKALEFIKKSLAK